MILRLHWWKEFRNDGLQNYGDLMSKFIVKRLSNKIVCTTRSKYNWWLKKPVKPYYIVIGSVIGAASENAIVWGCGIINRDQEVNNAKFIAVRGPLTRKRLLELGYKVPAIFGDPGLLMPQFIENNEIKKYDIGLIPHFIDYQFVVDNVPKDFKVKVINLLTNSVEKTTREILQCKRVVSTSLHGIIIPHSYQIPALWIKLSENLSGDDVKFYDYFESVHLKITTVNKYHPKDLTYVVIDELFDMQKESAYVSPQILKKVCNNLLESCPF